MIKEIHIKRLLLLFFLIIFGTVYSQSLNQKLDSIENSFGNVTGEERIERIITFIRNANFYSTKHQRFIPYIDEAYEWERKHSNIKTLNRIRLGHINLLLADGNREEAVRKIQEILHSGTSISSKDSVSVYTFMFDIYVNIGSFSKAWEAIRIRDQVLSNTQIQNSFFDTFKKIRIDNLAKIYLATENYTEAILQYKKLVKIAKHKNDFHFESGAYNNIGLVYLRTHKPDSAIIYFNKSLIAWKNKLEDISYMSTRDSAFFDIVRSNIGQAYNVKGEYKKAIPLIQNALETSKINKEVEWIVSNLNSLSLSYFGLRKPKKALALLDSATCLIEMHNSISAQRDTYQNKVKMYESLGDTKNAYTFYKKLVTYNSSMDSIGKLNRITILEIVYEVEQKNRQIDNQQALVIKAEVSAKLQKSKQRFLIIGLFLMLAIVINLLWNNYQKRKRSKSLKEKNKQIEEQNNTIEKVLVEKETLLKEIHHRVKNNLQLISGMLELQSSKINDDAVNEIMEQGQNRIKSMALIHQQLYESEDLGKIDFRKYVTQLTNDIKVMVNDPNKDIDIVLDIIDFSLDLDTAVPMGLIINELVLNAFKHGFLNIEKGTVTIGLKAFENEYYQLTVSDNGTGLPANFDLNNTNSLGLQLVKGLSRQIGGNCEFKNGNGTTVLIKFRNDKN
ncbi:MAG: histidine kinase dimerization/phosphoacceptor domain -containing protein [Flavobacteriaceae bacterium]